MFEIREKQCRGNDIVMVQGKPLFEYTDFIRLFIGRFLADVTYNIEDSGKYELKWYIPGKTADTLYKEVKVREISALQHRLYEALRLIDITQHMERDVASVGSTRPLLTAEILRRFALPDDLCTDTIFTNEGRLILINWGLTPPNDGNHSYVAGTTFFNKQRVDNFMKRLCETYNVKPSELGDLPVPVGSKTDAQYAPATLNKHIEYDNSKYLTYFLIGLIVLLLTITLFVYVYKYLNQ